ncbi:hypothetical protein Hanom_Chr08g00733271 [Helianthus anomalus]
MLPGTSRLVAFYRIDAVCYFKAFVVFYRIDAVWYFEPCGFHMANVVCVVKMHRFMIL